MIAKNHWPWPAPESEGGSSAANALQAPAARQTLDHLLAIQMRLELATEVPIAIYGPAGQVLPGISPARPKVTAPQIPPIKDLLTSQQWPRRIGQMIEAIYGANLHIFVTPLILKGRPVAQIALGPLQIFEPGAPGEGAVGSGPLGSMHSAAGTPILPSWRAQAVAEIARMIVSSICTHAPSEHNHLAQHRDGGTLSDQATTIMPILESVGRGLARRDALLRPLAQDAALLDSASSGRLQRPNGRAQMMRARLAPRGDQMEDDHTMPVWPPASGSLDSGAYPAVPHLEYPDWLRDLIEAMPQAVIISAAPGGQVVLANRAARRLWPRLLGEQAPGGASSAPLGLRVSIEQYPLEWQGLRLALREDAGLFRAEISIEVPGGAPYDAPQSPGGLAGQRPSGATDTAVHGTGQRPFLVSTFPLRTPQGIASHAVAIFEDISRLVDRELFKDELLLVAAHDARNPLTLISSYAQLLERNLALELPPGQGLERAHGRLAEIQEQVQALTELTNQLYTVTRLQSAQQRPRVEALNLARLLQRAAIDQQMLTPGRAIETTVEQDPCMVEGDPAQIQQIVMRLLKNAIRYSHPGKPIRVSLRCTPENNPLWAEVSIRDQGIGIPRASLPHVFERFYRVSDNEQRTRAAGLPRPAGDSTSLGLSLYLCKQLIEHMGGRIWIDSVEGQGTTVSFTVPLKG